MLIDDIATPCVGICKIHPTYKLCRGCYRSPLELRIWHVATVEQKKNILKELEFKKSLYGDIT